MSGTETVHLQRVRAAAIEADVILVDGKAVVLEGEGGGGGEATIADGSVTTAKLADGAVTGDKIAALAVTGSSIGTGAIGSSKLAPACILEEHLASAVVTEESILDGTITASKLADGAVSLRTMAAGSVDAAKLVTGAVTADKVASDAVETRAIADEAVTSGKLAADVITSYHLSAASVEASHLAFGAVTESKIDAGAVVEYGISDGAVTAPKVRFSNASGVVTFFQPTIISSGTFTGAVLNSVAMKITEFDVSDKSQTVIQFMLTVTNASGLGSSGWVRGTMLVIRDDINNTDIAEVTNEAGDMSRVGGGTTEDVALSLYRTSSIVEVDCRIDTLSSSDSYVLHLSGWRTETVKTT